MAVLVCTALEERLFHFLSQQLLITDNSNASSFIIYSHSHTQEGVTSLKKGSAVSLCGHGTLAVLITSKTSWTKEVIFLLHVALVRHPLECGVPSWAPQWQENYWETEASPSESCQVVGMRGEMEIWSCSDPEKMQGRPCCWSATTWAQEKIQEQVFLKGTQQEARGTSGNMLQGKKFTMTMVKKWNRCPEQLGNLLPWSHSKFTRLTTPALRRRLDSMSSRGPLHPP